MRINPGNTRFTPFDFVWYAWTHSRLMLCVWATAIEIGVVSHSVLDWVTHRPDMPTYPGAARYGLGL